MKRHWCFLIVILSAACLIASGRSDEFEQRLANASKKSSLTAPGSHPFHLKLEATDTRHKDPQYNVEIEVWWAGPDKWRREVKSAAFSQTSTQNGQHYYESNSSDYLPWWLHELIQESVDPVPLAELKNQEVEFTGRGCAQWETEYSDGTEKVGVHSSVCFNPDGTVNHLFADPFGARFDNYQPFDHKLVARSVTVSPKGTEVKGTVTLLESLKKDQSLFMMPSETGLTSRMRFLSIPESSLEPDDHGTAPITWPVIHNFPATGVMTINVKLDHSGSVREVGVVVSHNVVLQDTAVAQVKAWKFKPYLSNGSPVQVNTNIVLRYDTKVELLGANGKAYAVDSFLNRINKARELSDLRMQGGQPFHLVASFHVGESETGTYDETWLSPTKWRRRAQLGGVTVTESQSDNQIFRKYTGSDFSPRQIDNFLDGLDGPFPRTDGSFYEADWGQSAVNLDGIEMVRVARGQVDSKNQPITGAAYWFDSAGLLRASYSQPKTTTYSDFVAWNGRQVPHHMELTEHGVRLIVTSIETIEPASEVADALFVLDGVKPEFIVDPGDYDGPPLVQPVPILRVKPVNPQSGHGSVLVDVLLDTHGHVTSANVRQSAGQALDDAAVNAAMQWEFQPMLIKGRRVPGHTTLRFDF
jgi:TonB family protein